jgi:ABC-type multidrug transport system fused ATPase/permease subunit
VEIEISAPNTYLNRSFCSRFIKSPVLLLPHEFSKEISPSFDHTVINTSQLHCPHKFIPLCLSFPKSLETIYLLQVAVMSATPSPKLRGLVGAPNRQDHFVADLELNPTDDTQLLNDTLQSLLWKDVSVTVKDHKTKEPNAILQSINGIVHAGMFLPSSLLDCAHPFSGEICALMGPSGCGKTTLLNVLAQRNSTATKFEGQTRVNGIEPPSSVFRKLSSYVEQEDALIGSLTIRETLHFAARLSHKKYIPKLRLFDLAEEKIAR